MRWGMPPQDAYQCQWLVRDLKGKSERAFKAYTSLFMRHLCEPGADTLESFNDGVPREGLNRQNVLTRIGIMSLLRKKVQEFENVNGDWSIPEMREQQLSLSNNLVVETKESSLASSRDGTPSVITADGADLKTVDGGGGGAAPKNDVEMADLTGAPPKTEPDVAVSADTPAPEGTPAPDASQQELNGAPARKTRTIPPFKFNIADGGFTELHTLWVNEEKAAVPGNEYEIWHRRHDYWLLCGIVTYVRHLDSF